MKRWIITYVEYGQEDYIATDPREITEIIKGNEGDLIRAYAALSEPNTRIKSIEEVVKTCKVNINVSRETSEGEADER